MIGLRAFEVQLPYQKYQGPPIVVRFCSFVHLLSNYKFELNRKQNKILDPFQQQHSRAVRRSKNLERLVLM